MSGMNAASFLEPFLLKNHPLSAEEMQALDPHGAIQKAVDTWEIKARGLPREQQAACMQKVKTMARSILGDLYALKYQNVAKADLQSVTEKAINRLNSTAQGFCLPNATSPSAFTERLADTDRHIAALKDPDPHTFHFPDTAKLQHCLATSPIIADVPYFHEKGIPKKMAQVFANTEKYTSGVDLEVTFALEALALHESALIALQLNIADALRSCAKPPN